jgi:alpha-galactosidase
VRPAAFCAWTVDRSGVSLWLDVRNGGTALRPGDRVIDLATIRSVDDDGSVPNVQRALIDSMINESLRPGPRPPLVGANNWYYAYGVDFDPEAVRGDARTVVELSDDHPVRPYSVIDDGWTPGGTINGGPWDAGTPGLFDDMAELAAEIKEIGARPGLWFRPLRSRDEADRRLAIPRNDHDRGIALDPTLPEVGERVAADLRRFRNWGYELIKHDFSSYDILGRFGPAMGMELTDPDWSFADRSRTNAEITGDFYDLVREAAGDALLLGCNTFGHLAAGVVDAQRTGDDTSGRTWERTRRMGVNTLAHRLAQHGRFFTLDADCVPCTNQVPWTLHRQFLDLVARSGTALFVSVDPSARTEQTDADLAAALKIALDGGAAATDDVQPVDALSAPVPVDWRFGDERVSYDWSDEAGAWPFRA